LAGFYDGHFLDSTAGVAGAGQRPAARRQDHAAAGEYMNRHYHAATMPKAQNLRHHLRAAYDAVLADQEVMVMPTTVTRAQPIPIPTARLPIRRALPLDCPQGTLIRPTGRSGWPGRHWWMEPCAAAINRESSRDRDRLGPCDGGRHHHHFWSRQHGIVGGAP